MKIYVGHSSQFDYQNELYQPIMQSALWAQHEWYLPHLNNSQPVRTKEWIGQCDLILAEVSFPSTGLGIELGWAHSAGIPILAIYRIGSHISSSLPLICHQLLAYSNFTEVLAVFNQKIAGKNGVIS